MTQYECEECQDIGYKMIYKDGCEYAKKCKCYERRMSQLRLRKSGISEELQKKGFKDFEDRGISQLVQAKERAKKYYQYFLDIEKNRNNSIILCGQVGSGKTHLGMAICNNLLNVSNVGVVYMAYRNAIIAIKQTVMDKTNYYAAINTYLNARLLYIDDFLKGGRPTEADLNILYELVNYRYMHNKPMVISTEKMPEELLDFDEAVGSRILEMCRGNIVILKGRELNYRLYS